MRYLLVALLFCSILSGADYEVIPNKATLPILTPSLAKAKTLKIRLKNGLEAYLISDPEVDKSSAGLTVLVGSWDEPSSEPGLAHFTEHLLFLGNRKYPKEAEYHRFISDNGGTNNAFTAEDATSFMFSVDNKAFPDALDRFANFFKEPLFNPSGVSRELNAINQEYAKNLNSDDFRELYVLKSLTDPHHPFSRFNMGNLESLSHVSQETLKDWYRHTYSANLMRLVVISPLSLEQLTGLVNDAFKDVPNLNRPQEDLSSPLFLPATPSYIYIEPVKNVRKVTLFWDLPPKFAHMLDAKPDAILCYVLGHEGKGSLLADLKEEKLAEAVSCGSYQLSPNNSWMNLEITLTDGGLKNLEQVIERSFQALARFRETGVPKYLFDEVKQMATLRYEYQTRDEAFDTIMRYVSWLSHEKMETFPQGTQVIERFDPEAVKELLDYMTPQNAHYSILAPSSLTGIRLDRLEPWMKIPYAVVPISEKQLKTWEEAKPIPAITLPGANPYTPKSLELVGGKGEAKESEGILPHPEAIVDTPKAKIYFATDTRFHTPRIAWDIEILTPAIVQGDATQLVLGDLLVKSLKDSLNTILYPAALADISCTIARTDNGIAINIEGYNEKAPLLLKEVLKRFQKPSANETQFKIYKDSLLRHYQNFGRDNPINLAQDIVKSILYKKFSTAKEKAAAIRKINYGQFTDFAETVFSHVFIQAVLYGNMDRKTADEVAQLLLQAFPGEPYEERFKPEVLLLPDNQGPFYLEVKVPTKGNVSWLTIQDAPPFTFKKRAALQLIMRDLYAPFFDELRTKQQTGYLVYSGPEELERKLFGYFIVQSDTHAGRDLLARFELFLERYLQEAPYELTEEKFQLLKATQIENLRKANRNVKDIADSLNLLAFKYDGDFDWLDKRVAALQELKLEESLTYAKQLFSKQNRRRLGLMLNGELPEGQFFPYSRIGGVPQLRKLGEFQGR